MKYPSAYLVCLVFLTIFSIQVSGQNWDFVKEKDGIRIYTRNEPNSPFKSFRGIMDVNTTMDKVSQFIGNPKNMAWWDSDLREIKVLDYENEKFIRYYLIYDVIWPFTDRDLCVEARISSEPSSGTRIVFARPIANVVPENPDLIRIKNYWQKWTVQPVGRGVLRFFLEGYVDPGGSVPSWLYNMVITETPIKVMSALRKRLN